MADDLLAGGRYRVVRRLAQGGMGEVLLADFPGDTTLGISKGYVVLKRVLPEAQNRPHQTRMLREEARLSLRLLHENLVESFFLDEHEGDPILVMEFLAGRSLAQVLGLAKKTREMVPVEVTLAVVRAAACGLYFAHTLTDRGRPLGLIHRDVSPANVFIAFEGRTKVIDFGVAKSDDSEIRTSTGVLKGKLGYMSPEHAAGDVKLTPATDLWSLGVVMWECLCAERLFASASPSETLRAIADKPIPSPLSLRNDIPAEVVAICMGLLDRDPVLRINTGRQLVEAIDALPSALRTPHIDLGTFLSGRFPAELAAGIEEAKRCAHMRRRTPIPIGLVEGTASQAPQDGEMPTLVLKTEDARAFLQEARASVDPATIPMTAQAASGQAEEAPTKRVLARPGLLAEPDSSVSDGSALRAPTADAPEGSVEVDLSTRTQRIADLPPLGTPFHEPPRTNSGARSTPRTNPGQRSATGNRFLTTTQRALGARATSWLSVALLTFGLLALAMGVGLSFLAPPPPPPDSVIAYADPIAGPTVVAVLEHVPATASGTVLDLKQPVLSTAGAAPAALSADDTQRLIARLAEGGVLSRAALPATMRARTAAMLPLLIAGFGLLALALALPGFLPLSGTGRLLLQLLLIALVLAAAAVAVTRGALTWPGLAAYDAAPRVLVNDAAR